MESKISPSAGMVIDSSLAGNSNDGSSFSSTNFSLTNDNTRLVLPTPAILLTCMKKKMKVLVYHFTYVPLT